MSTATTAQRGTADEGIAARKLIAIGVFALAVFTISVVIAGTVWRQTTAHVEQRSGAPSPVAKNGALEVGIVNQEIFPLDGRAREYRRKTIERLESYGWVDREKGIAHIPIAEAMQKTVEMNRAAPDVVPVDGATPSPAPEPGAPAAPAPAAAPHAEAPAAAAPAGEQP